MTPTDIARFNEQEAVQQLHLSLRAWRSFMPNLSGLAPLRDELADDLDWQQVVRECRLVCAVGTLVP